MVHETIVKGSLRRSSFVLVPLACEVLSRARLACRPGSERHSGESVPLAVQMVTGLIGRMSAAAHKLPYQGAQPTSALPCSGMVLRIHQAMETTSPTILSMAPMCVSAWPHMPCPVHSCGLRPRSQLKFWMPQRMRNEAVSYGVLIAARKPHKVQPVQGTQLRRLHLSCISSWDEQCCRVSVDEALSLPRFSAVACDQPQKQHLFPKRVNCLVLGCDSGECWLEVLTRVPVP